MVGANYFFQIDCFVIVYFISNEKWGDKIMVNYEKQYSVSSINTGGRKGKSYLEDGTFAVNISPPGSRHEGANPEELFALGYSACFHAALDAVKVRRRIRNKSLVRLTVNYLHNPKNHLDIKLQVEIELAMENLADKEIKELADRANEICPYSRAIQNGHIDVTTKIVPYIEETM